MTPTPDTPADSQYDDHDQFRDLAMLHGISSSVRDAALRVVQEPTSLDATKDLRMLLGAPSEIARSALDRLQDSNRRRGLRVISGGLDVDEEER